MKKVLFFGVIMLVLSSCLKREQYPNRPDLEYLSYSFTSDTIPSANPIGEVTFRFTDGDGDLGLNPADTFGVHAIGEPYYYNLFVRYFEKKNGVFEEIIAPGSFNVRFNDLTPEGADKTLEGEMQVGIFDSGSEFDTVRYEMYIVDRALQHSDTISTPVIVRP
ncbi:MAG: hypothetical protein ACPGU4_03285 [Flavobacteriales bacterium]